MTDPQAPAADTFGTRRDRSVARVIDPARQRAEQRVQRFLDAALELLTGAERDFTLQEVVERSGLSLRSFYQHFGGKHELLLAVFEDSVRRTEEVLRSRLTDIDDPLERLHQLVVEYFILSGTGARARAGKGRQGEVPLPALSHFAQSLLSDHPLEASGAFTPIRVLFEEVLAEAVDAGVVRGTPRLRRRAAFLLQTVNFNSYVTASVDAARNKREERTAAEDLWELLLHGLQPSPA